MKQSNRLFSILFLLLIVVSFSVTACSKVNTSSSTSQQDTTEDTSFNVTSISNLQENTTTSLPASTTISKDSLFIGDSRAVGLAEYGNMQNIDFFANVGMSVYNIRDKKISVANIGKTTLENLLNHKQYGTIYIMLGINEAGYEKSKTIKKYKELISYIQEKEPNAKMYLQANLYVTKARSEKDSVINNPTISVLNQEIAKLADNQTIYYMDANSLFDDTHGNLSAEKTGDSAHLYAKYYAQWGTWILEQTKIINKEK